MARHLWLVGMMGSGKSSVGRLVADHFGWGFVDADDVVTANVGRTIADFWRDHGEEGFRDEESAAIATLAAGPSRVIATGGGAILREENVQQMRDSGFVIWLQAGAEALAQRVGSTNRRPLLAGQDPLETLQQLLDAREGAYRAAAHATIATDGLELETVVTRIEELWNAY